MQCRLSVQGSSGQARGRRLEHKSRNGHVESMAVFGHKKVTAVHGAAGRAKAAATGVLKRLTWPKQRLTPDHAKAFDLVSVPVFVLNDPVARNQLHRNMACVGDGDGISKSKDILEQVALVCRVLGQNVNLNGVGRHTRMLTATIEG